MLSQLINKDHKFDLEIVICTHNRASLLSRTLRYLKRAIRPLDWKVEIIVVANACNDETISILETYELESRDKNWLPLRWVVETKPGKSNALNRVIPTLSSPLIAYVDDDHRVDEKYLISIQDASRKYPNSMIFCGRILPDWDGTEPVWVHDKGRYKIYPLPVPQFDHGDVSFEIFADGPMPGGGNQFVRREAFEIVGNYRLDLGPEGHNLEGSEDMEWVNRALRLGLHLQYVPSVIQYHYIDHNRFSLSYLMRKAYKRTASMVRLSDEAQRGRGIPKYLARKIASNFGRSMINWCSTDRRRFYLVRFAASLGEAKGFIDAVRDRRLSS